MQENGTFGANGSIADILFSEPERFGPLLAFAQDLMRGSGVLTKPERELLAAYVSGLNSCSFCYGVHLATAERFGVNADLLENLLVEGTLEPLSPRLRPIFAFARKLTLEPSRISSGDRQVIFQTGYDQSVISQVTVIVALFSFFNRLVEGHGVKGNDDIFARDSEMLANVGYLPPA